MREARRIDETTVQSFWNSHPCGDHIVGGLQDTFANDYEQFFAAYDAWRYQQEDHIPHCLDQINWHGLKVLEIGLGQGTESEQLIRRGAQWSGLDLTGASVDRVRARLNLRGLPYEDLRQGSALAIPWPDNTFDIVFSHGVLHHIPDIRSAQSEIHRILKPGGQLIAMLYARRSLNYQLSIRVIRRFTLMCLFPFRRSPFLQRSSMLHQHLENADAVGLRRYLAIDAFTSRSTDGPLSPYGRVYSPAEVVTEFPSFDLTSSSSHYMHAPPLPARWLPLERWLGWHLWVQLRARPHVDVRRDASDDARTDQP